MEEKIKMRDYFISEDGDITIKFKVETEDNEEREAICGYLMQRLNDSKDFEMPKGIKVSQIYFSGNDPITTLKKLKTSLVKGIETYIDDLIREQ